MNRQDLDFRRVLPLHIYDLPDGSLANDLDAGALDFGESVRCNIDPQGARIARLKPLCLSFDALHALAESMSGFVNGIGADLGSLIAHESEELRADELFNMPAGYTYFGQFVVHDVTFQPRSGFELRRPSPRTFQLDLDSLYGAGPTAHPYLYEPRAPDRLALAASSTQPRREQYDVPRTQLGIACIEDPRNDENVMVSQIHVAIARAHNVLAQAASRITPNPRDSYARARRVLTWLYQWVVITDWLQRLLPDRDRERLLTDLTRKPSTAFGGREACLTAEFSFAVCRFGHAMVRPRYQINGHLHSLAIAPWGDQPEHAHLTMFRPLLPDWFVDWRLFFELSESQRKCIERLRDPLSQEVFGAESQPWQPARRIRPRVSRRLGILPALPGQSGRLAMRTLRGGVELGLPSGSDLASALHITTSMEPERPLWYSILDEADKVCAGERLGPLGSCIVAETILGALQTDQSSFLFQPGFQPQALSDSDAADSTEREFDVPELLLLGDRPVDQVYELFRPWLELEG